MLHRSIYASSMATNLGPMKDFLAAQDKFRQGDTESALALLSQSVGAEKPLDRVGPHLDKVFDSASPLSDLMLRLALVRTRERR